MEDFNILVTKLTRAADAGEVAEVQSLLKDSDKEHYLWQPSKEQAAVISKAVASLSFVAGEELLKAWIVTSVNEWGGDQERMLVLTTVALYRVKFDFDSEAMEHSQRVELSQILRVEFGKYAAAKRSLTTAIWKRDLESQVGLRVYTAFRDGQRSVNDVARERFGPMMGHRPPPQEYFREYRALNAEDAPWLEDVFVQELAAAMMAASKLARGGRGESLFEVKPADLTKEVPGGLFTMLYNSLAMGKYTKAPSPKS